MASDKENVADQNPDNNKNTSAAGRSKDEENRENKAKDPHRGTADTPPQSRDMLPDSGDADAYPDEDGALDEELEDLDDEEDDPEA